MHLGFGSCFPKHLKEGWKGAPKISYVIIDGDSRMPRNYISYERPFELLKLVRDGVIRNLREVEKLDIIKSTFCRFLWRFQSGLEELGFIEVDARGNLTPTTRLNELTSALNISLSQLSGYESGSSVICSPAFGLPVKPPKEAEIFVLMPFAKDLRPVYEDHIRAVASNLGLSIARADDFFTADSVVSDIWNAINACRVIVADCTDRNPNVFYEIGIAHTLGKPVVLIAQTMDDIPFDVRHYRAIVYEFTPRGMREFESALISTIKHEISVPVSIEGLIKDSG